MNDQELFDEVVTHVLKQGEQAAEEGSCVYLTANGLSCAVGGPLVARNLYTPDIYGATVRGLRAGRQADCYVAFEAALDAWGVCSSQWLLLQKLQQAHDKAGHNNLPPFIEDFRIRATNIAAEHKLNTKVLE